MELANARVLITGGATGIGLATARAMADGGACIAVCGRREEPLERARNEFGFAAVQGDVSVEADAVRIVSEADEALGGINVLINNAAFGRWAKLVDVAAQDMTDVLMTNVVGATLVARECAKRMIERNGGTIVNIGSTASNKGYPGGSAYAASKFALNALTECWRAELRQHDIRVMQVNPSEVQTGFNGKPEPTDINPTKLVADDCAHLIVSLVTLADRGFVTDATLWATNPK